MEPRTPLLPSLQENDEHRPVHEDVQKLASALGRVIRSVEGQACFDAVEQLRTACRARRDGLPDAPGIEQLLAGVEGRPLSELRVVARAFALFFLLVNTAEQVFRVRQDREHDDGADAPAEAGTFRRALQRLRERGCSPREASRLLAGTNVSPVLTAHPTQAVPHTVMDLQARVADKLLRLHEASGLERARLEEALQAEVEMLWLTSEVHEDRPSVLHEVDHVLWYLEHRLPGCVMDTAREVRQAFADVFGQTLDVAPRVRFGSWVGGDRDGNPLVTPEITLQAARRAARRIIRVYRAELTRLREALSWSRRIRPPPGPLEASLERDRDEMPEVWERIRKRDAGEPLRLKLAFMNERLKATLGRIEGGGSGGPDKWPSAYADPLALEEDLQRICTALASVKAQHTVDVLLHPLLASVRAFGFHGYRLDVRQEASRLDRTVDALYRVCHRPTPDREALLEQIEKGRLLAEGSPPPDDDRARETLETFRAIRRIQQEHGEPAASTYIISMARSQEDLLRVLLLAREAGLVDLASEPPRSGLDVVPLFETLRDLKGASSLMQALFETPVYRRQLQARGWTQEVMVGYSDSTKDAGILPASWAVYRAQRELAEVCRNAGVKLTVFHGRGGTVGRGGGSPVLRALSALPPGSVDGSIRVTEQGEVIRQKYGLAPVARTSLEVLITGTLIASFREGCVELTEESRNRYHGVMDRLAELSLPVYRGLVYEDPRLFRLFRAATPVQELSHFHLGSRPAYRGSDEEESPGSIRAIPWIFGWTQIRLNLPAWLGAGSALSAFAGSTGGLETLREMARSWSYFDDLLGKVEMICAKTDMEVARTYIERLHPEGLELWETLASEFDRATEAILKIRRRSHLLADQPFLQSAILHRDRYIDPLSLLQIDLLRRKRRLREDDPEVEAVDRILGTTLNGIAQGLRNTA